MLELAQRAIDVAIGLGATYADARVINQDYQYIQTKDLTVAGLNLGTSRGIGIRVLCNGGWGFASTQELTQEGVTVAARRAVEVAMASSLCLAKPVELAREPVYRATWVSPHLIDPFTISLEDKIGVLFEAARTMLKVKGVTLAQGDMTFIRDHKLFVSSEGSCIDQTFTRSSCGIVSNATEGDDRQRRSWPNSFGGQHENAGWEMVAKWDLPGNAQRIAEESVALLTAPQCQSSVGTVVIGASQVGLQVHESCGHPSELDRALLHEINFAGASFLTSDKLNNLKYGSNIVNLVADATTAGALGGFGFDDEGVQAQDVALVKDGMFVGYLSSRDTAHMIGLERSGGAMRAESWNRQPIIRMTNISLLPGNAGSLEDLIADTDDGIYLDTNKSWSIDDRRYNFQFSTEAGYIIKKGKLAGLVKNPSYGGITTEFWNSCDAICGEDEYVHWGLPNCGKGQPCQTMWTGHGAAPARFRNVQIGVAFAK
ncbi:MAG TPA: TldD/PmbA family protein [Chroococcales cyanobacterium]